MKTDIKISKPFVNQKGIKGLLARSHKATCGITEREVVVPRQMAPRRIAQLKQAGFYVIGTSHGQTPTKKIWFIRRGGL